MEMSVEFSLKKRQVSYMDLYPEWFNEIIRQYKTYESDARLIFVVPNDWEGFKDGRFAKMNYHFGEGLYCAIAFVTTDSNCMVTDLEGRTVENFPVVVEGAHGFRYVKRRLRIKQPIEGISGLYSIMDYIVNPLLSEPIMKVLDVYAFEKTDIDLFDKVKKEKE
jgi:hypothetical protein